MAKVDKISLPSISLSNHNIRPLQEARFCSNLSLPSHQTGRKEFLTPQLLFGNEDVKRSDNEEVRQKIVSISLFK